MKANELMIGDIVMASTYDEEREEDVFHPARINAISSIQELFDGNWDIEWLDDCESESVADLEPIHLTKEILNANGFEKTGDYVSIHENGARFETYGNHVFSYRSNVICDIFYVHELQHALRLCGLNDLADNFKL